MRRLGGIIMALIALLVVILIGYQSATKATHPIPTSTTLPSTQPHSLAPLSPGNPTSAVVEAQSQPTSPPVPPYVEIAEVVAGRRPKVAVTLTPPAVLSIRTEGVRTLRLLRAHWPHEIAGSIAINIDGQGIEWTRRRDVLELNCGVNGGWSVAPPP